MAVNISLSMMEEEYTQEGDHLAHLEYLKNSEKKHMENASYQEQGSRHYCAFDNKTME